ncbi:MAG: DUF554 domain-containing protein [Firmicutes bacterium]|nr:DUF554 domain-containing protein [Bacillota bacterium]
MIGLGTLINTGAIVAGGLLGSLIGKAIKETTQDSLTKACGVATMFISIGGALEGMLQVEGPAVSSGKGLFIVLCLALDTLIGELIDLEKGFERFGEWLKKKTGNAKDAAFVNAFVTTSLTVCIGAMAIVGSIQDGILGDYSTLAVKSVLDFVILIVLTSSLGKGSIFSAIPVFLLQGGMTLLARLISPIFTDTAIANISLIGSILIFCVGINLVWGKKIRVANMLPALVLAVIAAFLPWI